MTTEDLLLAEKVASVQRHLERVRFWPRFAASSNAVHLGRQRRGRAAETRCVKRQEARDAKTLEEPAKELDERVSELPARSIGFLGRDSWSRSMSTLCAWSSD